MSSGEDPCPEHAEQTRRRALRYCFSRAHHGRGMIDDSQWARDLGEVEEFSVFDTADWYALSDSKGHLYGLRRGGTLEFIPDLGTEGQKIAKFWKTHEGLPWHGFPLWPISEDSPPNRRKTVAPKEALKKMETAGLLLPDLRKRLQKGGRI